MKEMKGHLFVFHVMTIEIDRTEINVDESLDKWYKQVSNENECFVMDNRRKPIGENVFPLEKQKKKRLDSMK